MTGLEALQEICGYYYQSPQYKLIEKELKVLEIIKEKRANVDMVFNTSSVEEYNDCRYGACLELTQEEYDLLKEML